MSGNKEKPQADIKTPDIRRAAVIGAGAAVSFGIGAFAGDRLARRLRNGRAVLTKPVGSEVTTRVGEIQTPELPSADGVGSDEIEPKFIDSAVSEAILNFSSRGLIGGFRTVKNRVLDFLEANGEDRSKYERDNADGILLRASQIYGEGKWIVSETEVSPDQQENARQKKPLYETRSRDPFAPRNPEAKAAYFAKKELMKAEKELAKKEKRDKPGVPFLARVSQSGKVRTVLAVAALSGAAGGGWAANDYFDGKDGGNAPVQQGFEAPVTFPMPAVPAIPTKPEALPAGPELPAVTKTGSLPDNLTVKLVDLVGADIKSGVAIAEQPALNDLSVDIKIVPVEGQKMSTFDWSVAKAFERIGIHLIDGNEPVLNGDARWQLTTMIAHSMGLEPAQLNLVYMGDEFTGIKITPEIIEFVQAQNVVVPDSVLQTAGLVSLPADNQEPVESVAAAAITQTSGSTTETVGQGPQTSGGSDFLDNIGSGSLAPAVVTESAETNVNTEKFAFETARRNGDGTSDIEVTPLTDLGSRITWKISEENANILTEDSGKGSLVEIESRETATKINYVYRRANIEIPLFSKNTPAYAAALKAEEDAKAAEEESFWEYYQMLMLLGASTAAAGAVLMMFKSTRAYGKMMLAGSVVTTPVVIGAMELSYLSNLPVYPTLGGLAAAAAALAAYALKQRGGEVKVGDDEEDLDGELVIGRTTAATY